MPNSFGEEYHSESDPKNLDNFLNMVSEIHIEELDQVEDEHRYELEYLD